MSERDDNFDRFSDLLGAYALDAVDPDERDLVELHLADCPRCRAEVAGHREVAAYLSQTGAAAPEGVWDRIVAELSPPAPALRMSFSPTGEVDPLGGGAAALADEPTVAPTSSLAEARARRGIRARTFVAAIGAAAAIVLVLGLVAVNQFRRLDKMESAVGGASLEQLANEAVGSSKVQVHLEGEGGQATAVVDGTGQGYLFKKDLPATPDGDVYQLWGKVDDETISLGLFGDDTSVVPFTVDAQRLDGVEAFMVTQERAGGVAATTNVPVVIGTV